MTQGSCRTNTKQESVHRQPVSLKEYLICIYYHKSSRNDDRAFEGIKALSFTAQVK